MAGLAAAQMSSGSEFQSAGPACQKVLSPNLVRNRGMTYLLLEANHRPVRVAALLYVWMMSLRHAGLRRASISVNSIHDHVQFEVDKTTDRPPVQHHQAWHDVVVNVQLVDEMCCSILYALRWLIILTYNMLSSSIS